MCFGQLREPYTARVTRESTARQRRKRLRLRLVTVGATVVALAAAITVAISGPHGVNPAPSASATLTPTEPVPAITPTPSETPTPTTAPSTQWDIDSASSFTVVVNKQRPLRPLDYVPADLRAVNVAHTWDPQLRDAAATAVERMFAAATSEAGLSLASNSAYRSYATQQKIYKGDDLSTARPGFSEHQTGLAIDIGAASGKCSLATCFASTPEGKWLAGNAWRFGFVLRYPDGQTAVTGYEFEPWHYRFIGIDAAAAYHAAGSTSLEAFFGLPAAPNY